MEVSESNEKGIARQPAGTRRRCANRTPLRPSASGRAASSVLSRRERRGCRDESGAINTAAPPSETPASPRPLPPALRKAREVAGERTAHGANLQHQQFDPGWRSSLLSPPRGSATLRERLPKRLRQSSKPHTGPGSSRRVRFPPPGFAATLRQVQSAENDREAATRATAANVSAERAAKLPACAPSGNSGNHPVERERRSGRHSGFFSRI